MINIVRVYDKQKDNTYRCYCGRSGKGVIGLLGNPFSSGTRDENCINYAEWFKTNKPKYVDELVEIAKTQDIELACFCQSPKDVVKKRCHTETIKAYIEQQLEESKMRYTPESITELKPNEIFVFGSNTQGRHGKGAAKLAMQFGAIYGIAEGHQGDTYAIITKDLTKSEKFPLRWIKEGIVDFLRDANNTPSFTYLVTKIGCGLGGYTVNEIANLFIGLDIPDNVVLPKEFWDYILDYDEDHPNVIKAKKEESKMQEFELIGNLGIDKANALLNQVSNEQFSRTNTYSAEYYGTCPYKYTGANHPAKEMPKYLSDLASELEVKENLPNGYFNMVLINRYPSNKGLGRHRDNEPEISALSSIASISLGASRIFSITKGYNNPYLELELTHGDVVMMRGRSQIDYYHAVIPGEGIRFNLTFRHNANAPIRGESKMKTQANEPIGIIRPVVNQMQQVPSFRNELAFLSNMFEYPINNFKCAETYYQAHKVAGTEAYTAFLGLNGYEAKRLGKQVELRSDWNEVKLSIMEKILRVKFQGELLQKLLAVKGEIVERNNWGDSYWGICNGKGQNQLGKLLMKIRDETVKPELKEIPSMTYSGIGSRSTPAIVLQQMANIAFELRNDFVLYSGAAPGADKAFSEGTTNKIEFIPWKGFNNCSTGIVAVSNEAMELAATLHPAWDKLSQGAKKLMARNCHQILGEDLNSPVDFVLCWTPDGAETKTGYNTGGTGQAIRLANRYGISVINMFNVDWKQRLDVLLEDIHILNQANQISLSTY